MSSESEEFFKVMIGLLPSTRNDYEESVSHFGEVLETVIIEDIFMPKIIELLKTEKNIELIQNIFEYFEEVSDCKDGHLINIFSVTVLEVLCDNSDILNIAQKYMGSKTIQLQMEVIKGM